MGQQISIEAALNAFRQEFGKVADENVLLKARVSELEAELERRNVGTSDPHPSMVGPVGEQG